MPTKTKSAKSASPKQRVVKVTKASKAQFAAVEPAQILGRAMLVNVCIGIWEGRKHDREVTARVNDEYQAAHDAGRYNKHLFGGKVKTLSAIITATAGLRGTHYNQTLPWSDAGWRLLPTENYFAYTEAMRKQQQRFRDAVREFADEYPTLVADAKERLGKMYRASDYPSPESVVHKFHADLQFSPLPAGGDFRVSLPEKELARVAHEVEDRLARSVKEAMQEAWTRLGDAIVDLREKLDDGKYLRDTMISRLREVAEVLGRLNLTGDAALESARHAVLTNLTGYSAETLRDDDKVRAEAASRADEILKAMQGVYSPSTGA